MSLKSCKELEKNQVELEVVIPKADFDEAVTKVFRKKAANMNVPGFRRGKAPRAIIEKMYGKGVFYDDALNDILPGFYSSALEESKVRAVSRPEFDIVSIDENGVLLTAKLYRKPDVSIKDYLGVKAEKTVAPVTDEMVDSEILRLRERNSRSIDVLDRPAQNGDIVTFDFDGYADGKPFEGGKAEKYDLKLGSGQFIPGFEDQLVGKTVGGEFDVNVTFPTDYHAKELAGKPAVFKCKLHAIKMTELPEADDEFAKDVSEFDTLAQLKADIKDKKTKQFEEMADKEVEGKIIDVLLQNFEAEVPEAMYETETENLVRDYDNNLRMQGMNLTDFFKYTGMDLDKLRAEFRPRAERQVKTRLALEKIVELEKITATPEEIASEYEKLAKNFNMKVEDVKAGVPEEGVRDDICVDKAIALVKEKAVITEKAPEKDGEKAEEKAEKPARKAPAKKAAPADKSEKSEKAEKGEKAPAEKRPAKKKEAAGAPAAKEKPATTRRSTSKKTDKAE